ncbi:MAG TPA: hypothetical protein VHP33_27905 [Polyangiaceae bacterium]|nr:hypothetical protein [Polyangiaceae bacterium]
MKARHVLWPVVIFSAVSLAGACSSDSGTGTTEVSGGSDGEGGNGPSTGATTSTGATSSNGGMSTDAGASTGATGGASGGAAGAAGAGGAAVGDLCEGKELDCPDDDNPCTEDECNPDTGECGIPRSETSCDDGVYCNGADTCDAGECSVHEGNPCSGTCNEAGEYCECATKDDCPADEVGEYGDCAYATECVETAMKSRTVTKYSCNGVGKCVAGAPTIETAPCTRETDTNVCTTDGNRCNGTEKCKNGQCTGDNVNPCAGQAATPFCYPSGEQCRKCTGSTVANTVGCAANQKCCDGSCIASANNCFIVLPQLGAQIGSQIVLQ